MQDTTTTLLLRETGKQEITSVVVALSVQTLSVLFRREGLARPT